MRLVNSFVNLLPAGKLKLPVLMNDYGPQLKYPFKNEFSIKKLCKRTSACKMTDF